MDRKLVIKGLLKSARKLRTELDALLESTKGEFTDEVDSLQEKVKRCESTINEQLKIEFHRVESIGQVPFDIELQSLAREFVKYRVDSGLDENRNPRGNRRPSDKDLSDLAEIIVDAMMKGQL